MAFDDSPLASSFAASPAGRAFVTGGPLTPDQVVCTVTWPLLLDVEGVAEADLLAHTPERFTAHETVTGSAPVAVVTHKRAVCARFPAPSPPDAPIHHPPIHRPPLLAPLRATWTPRRCHAAGAPIPRRRGMLAAGQAPERT